MMGIVDSHAELGMIVIPRRQFRGLNRVVCAVLDAKYGTRIVYGTIQ
jgi:hypothetical protein